MKRVLKEKEYQDNILTAELFGKSQQLFEDACRELKSEGLESVQHYPEITPSGIYCIILHIFSKKLNINVHKSNAEEDLVDMCMTSYQ